MGSSKDQERHVDALGSIAASASDERYKDKKPRRKSIKIDRVKSEKERDRDRDRDRDREREKDRDGRRPHKSKSTRSSKGLEDDSLPSSHRRHRTKEEKERDRERAKEKNRDKEREHERERDKKDYSSDHLPDQDRPSILTESRASLPYPGFSKAHSREYISSQELPVRHADPSDHATPDATDLGSSSTNSRPTTVKSGRSASSSIDRKASAKVERPPTPPETDLAGAKRRSSASSSTMHKQEKTNSKTSAVPRSSSKRDAERKTSTGSSSQATYIPKASPSKSRPMVTVEDYDSTLSQHRVTDTPTTCAAGIRKRSNSKSTPRMSEIMDDDSPDTAQDSSPKTPTASLPFPSAAVLPVEGQKAPSPYLSYDGSDRPRPVLKPGSHNEAPHPPPPPPPPLNIQEVPRVDYLLQNGGLPQVVPKSFLSVVPRHHGTKPGDQAMTGSETLFAPLFGLLDQYQTVIQKQGSVAVATGHRSVARRLLNRLENVFSRDLPERGCSCIMCEKRPQDHHGLSWGEVLESVGGRADLPAWPPFDLAALGMKAAKESAGMPARPHSPIKMDPDISEEFRDHYMRQSKKVRQAVDTWLNVCVQAPATPPQDVDDETLAFAILTSLSAEERPYFNALLTGARELQPTIRAPTPNIGQVKTEFITRCGGSLQRLYRLPYLPRDAEIAMYLVKNPFHHDLLVTISDISTHEWEILISGRFDGFLWSGADADDSMTPTAERAVSRGPTPANGCATRNPSRGPMTAGPASRQASGYGGTAAVNPSRITTPFSAVYSRGATPASFLSLGSSAAAGHSRQAVSHDEEVEMAVLAEVEREIYQGMEALEDVFEKLHHRAETVRNALRQRNAGLMMSMQYRRAGGPGGINVLPQHAGAGTTRPPWTGGEEEEMMSESDWCADDADSLAPDDSASNISSSRHRRPKRRVQRRTPAPIEEDDEEA